MIFLFIRKIKECLSYETELRSIVCALLDKATDEVTNISRVLDVGCGTTSMLRGIAKNKNIRRRFILVGLDVYPPTIEWNKTNGFHDEYMLSDIRCISSDESFDYVVAMDLVEHFDKLEENMLIKNMQKIANKEVIIITPNGFIENTPLDENEYMLHKCGFSTSNLRGFGYKVLSAGGAKFLKGMYVIPKYNKKIMEVILYALGRVFRYLPNESFHLIAIKRLG